MIPGKRPSSQLSDVEEASRQSQKLRTADVEIKDYAPLVRAVFHKVWNEFDQWSKEALVEAKKRMISEENKTGNTLFEGAESLTTDTQALARLHTIALQNRVDIEPLPSYESCAPISNNQFVGDDPSNMPFIPLADDPSFDWKEHSEKYKSFSWQTGFFDSDLHSIVVETAHRLHREYGLSYSQIDNTRILPLPLIATQGGILQTTRYRGSLNWTGTNPDNHKPVSFSRQWEFEGLLSQFCIAASCMIGFCDQHNDWLPIPPPSPVTPRVLSDDLIYDIVSPCGKDCFIRVPGHMQGFESNWTETDVNTFNILLEYSPDASPCHIAVICKKPCYEVHKPVPDFLILCSEYPSFQVFKRRKRTLPDHNIKKRPSENGTKRLPLLKANTFNDLNSSKFQINPPCHHKGPCNAETDCACFQNGAHCERSCRCDIKTCRRRWPGCNCVRTKSLGRPCGTDRCSCFKAHRECDPEVCGKCEARGPSDHRGCLNVPIQQQCWKSTETKDGRWGFGLFLLEPAEPGELIMEYVGQLIYDPTTESRDDVSTHRRRNYLFDLNLALAIDSDFAGNGSRFINHSKKDCNCRAQVMMVTGNHRIGIYAKTYIEAGAELFLNYGTQFFKTA